MQDNKKTLNPEEDERYMEYRRAKLLEEAKANVSKIECDCLSQHTDKVSLKEVCKQADALAMGAIVVFPSYVKACVSYLGSDPKVSLIAAVSYPLGADVTEIKAGAVKRAVKDGVDEVEVCAPISFIKDGNWTYLKRECKKVVKAGRSLPVRLVLNCQLLSEKELLKACSVAAESGVRCVRLSGADGELVSTVKNALKGKCLVKADKADNAAAFTNLCVMGADYVGCTSACELASLFLKEAEDVGK